MTTPAPSANADRLNGWKEIAAHLGKGPRTAQRWEKEYGLPVHRVGREGGEIVFAFRDEIDRWSRRAAGAAPLPEADAPAHATDDEAAAAQAAPSRSPSIRRVGAWVVGGVAAAALATVAVRGLEPSSTPAAARGGPPAAWRFTNGVLTVLDDDGRLLFRHDLGPAAGTSASSAEPVGRSPMVRIVDIDGDGRPETLVSLPAERRDEARLLCYEADGHLRFADGPSGDVRFGTRTYGAPWVTHRFFVVGAGPERSLYAAFAHNIWFPTRLRRLDGRGRLIGEYWSNGYVLFVDEAVWHGRKVVLAGGVANDVGGGGLAVLDARAITGHAPSADEDHLCRSCPAGAPVARFTFPTMCLYRHMGRLAPVVSASVESGDRLTVGVAQGSSESGRRLDEVLVYYTFGPDLSLVHAEVTPEFRSLHARLERDGAIDHAFGARDEADMFPVRLFDAAGVRVVKPVSVSR